MSCDKHYHIAYLKVLIDENRGHLLEAGFPQEVVSMLEGYIGTIQNGTTFPPTPLPLSVLHLKVARTAIGVLLNTTLGYGMYLMIPIMLLIIKAAYRTCSLSSRISRSGNDSS